MDWINQRVQFKICDVYHPDPVQILTDLHGNDLLTGKIVDLSDSGLRKNVFAVIEVGEIQELVIVPIERVFGSFEDEDRNESPR